DNTLKLWDAASGALLRTFKGHSSWVRSVAFSPDGGRVLSGSFDGKVKLWDVATGALLHTFDGHSGWVRSVPVAPDGGRVLSCRADRTLKVWGAANGEADPHLREALVLGHFGDVLGRWSPRAVEQR